MELSPAYLLSLPIDILIYRFFPELTFEELSGLCSSYSKFNDICQDESVWRDLAKYSFDIDSLPQGVNSWYIAYQLYKMFNDPFYAANTVESLLLKASRNGYVSLRDKELMNPYLPVIGKVSYNDADGQERKLYIHKILIYDALNKTLLPLTSLDQIRIFKPEENIGWRTVEPEDASLLNAIYFQADQQDDFFFVPLSLYKSSIKGGIDLPGLPGLPGL